MNASTLPLIANYQPAATLIWRGQQGVSQQQFLGRAAALSRHLPEVGYVVNLCRDRYFFALGFCAALMRGSTSLLPPNRQRQTLVDIGTTYPDHCCVVDSDEDPGLASINIAAINETADTTAPLPQIPRLQCAAIAFTSGSTGKPVANEKYWMTLCGTAQLLAGRLATTSPAPTIVATVPSQHMYGLEMTLMMALQGGCAIDSSHPFFAEDVAASLQRLAPPRLLVTTPVHLRHLLGSGLAMPATQRVVSATAPLSVELARTGEQVFAGSVYEIFGCTEAGSIATRHTVDEDSWTLLDGMSMIEQRGAIQVKGPQLRYAASLQDQLQLQGHNRFRFLGRSTDMINVGGKRASLADLTSKLLQLEGVSDGIVFMPRGGESQRPAALVVSDLSERQIARLLAERIDPVLVPRPLKKVARIPRNETGKATDQLLQEALQ